MSKFMTVARNNLPCRIIVKSQFTIGCVNEYPIMHYIGIPRHTQSMIAYNCDWVFLDIRLENCIVGILLTCPIIGTV